MQLTEMDLIATVVGLVLIGAVFKAAQRHRLVDRHTRAAQRPWRRRSALLSLAYVAALIAVTGAMNRGWISDPIVVILGVAILASLGLALIWVSFRELRAADEFVQKVETESLALAFALSFVGIVARAQLMSAGILSDLGVLGVLHVMIFAFLFARFYVYLRYR